MSAVRGGFPFFKLPIELRNRIYGEVLGPSTTIHVIRPHGAPEDHFLFLRCTTPLEDTGECLQCEYLNEQDLKPDHRVYDMSFLHVSIVVREEVSRLIFSCNEFWFPNRRTLEGFGRIFFDQTKYMQSISYFDIYVDHNIERKIRILQTCGDTTCRAYPATKNLTVYLRCYLSLLPNRPIFAEGILNYFRPLGRLPLSKVRVHVAITGQTSDDRFTPEMMGMLEAKAERILLSAPSSPEQEMRLPPQDIDSGMGQHREMVSDSYHLWAMLIVLKRKSKGLLTR